MKSIRRNRSVLNSSRFAAYSAAGAVACMGGTQVDASIVYVPVNATVSDSTIDGNPVASPDLLFGTSHLTLSHHLENATEGLAFSNPESQGTPGVELAGFFANGYNYINNVTYNAEISTLSNFLLPSIYGSLAFKGGYISSQFLNAGISYIGVRFNTNQYGWVRLNMGGNPLNNFEVVDFAYAGPGETITAGQVPEPGSLAMLALGAVALLGWRRREK